MDEEDANSNFDQRVYRAINRALDSIGDSVREVLFWTLESEYSLGEKDIARNPTAVEDTLERILGPQGAGIVVGKMIEELAREFNLPQGKRAQEMSLLDVVREARKNSGASRG